MQTRFQPQSLNPGVSGDFPRRDTPSIAPELVIYPLSHEAMEGAFGLSSTTIRKYLRVGMGRERGQAINSDDELTNFCYCCLWCSLGKRGGRGTPFNPAVFADLLLQEERSPGSLIQSLYKVGFNDERISAFIQQVRTRLGLQS